MVNVRVWADDPGGRQMVKGHAVRRAARSALMILTCWIALQPADAQVRPFHPASAHGPGSLVQASVAGDHWLAVGRMDIARRGFCTVTLIAPDRVLTAAHCVTDRQTGRARPTGDFLVQLGFDNGQSVATRGVRDVLTARRASDAESATPPIQAVASDMAILVLDQPVSQVGLQPVSLSEEPASEGQLVSVVSYARGRSEAAALQDDCIVIMERADGAMVLDCDVDRGASGAPVMVRVEGEHRIVAVISARAEMQMSGFPDAPVALAAPLPGAAGRALMGASREFLVAGDGGGAAQVRIRRPETGPPDPNAPGARFVRPRAPAGPGGNAAARHVPIQ
jgi:protease YdgD